MTVDGYPDSTAVAIIERATTPRERTLRSTLAAVVADAEREEVKAPAIIVVGGVVKALQASSPSLLADALSEEESLMPAEMVELVRVARTQSSKSH